ncbi:MAG: hypothetical protein AAF990_21690 [Bacteroidota bacterium]
MSVDDKDKRQSEDVHPLLPSGEWEGFYCYNHSPEQHKMQVELNFSNAVVSGSGIDDVASFTWKGQYDLEKLKLSMTKHYATHKIFYRGDIDENGIWGLWECDMSHLGIPQGLAEMIKDSLKEDLTGGFHIWPKKQQSETNSNSLEAQNESKKLKEIFIEVFG